MRFLGKSVLAGIVLFSASQTAFAVSSDGLTQPVKESLDKGVVRFFPSADAKNQCEPSYSLLPSVHASKSAPESLRESPQFVTGGDGITAQVDIPAGTSLYGVGLEFGPLLRNGRKFVAYNFDAYGYNSQGPNQLYESHPWVLGVRADGSSFGVLADTTYRCTIDLTNGISFTAPKGLAIIVIDRSSPQQVVQELARLIGTMPMPPKWALGYQQSHYSYSPASQVLAIANAARANKIPCDAIWMDIDYMDHFRDFSFSPERFPDPKSVNDKLHALHVHNIWMLDSAVRYENPPTATRVFSTGTAQHVWVSNPDGTPFIGDQWPSWDSDKAMQAHSVFPDFTSPAVQHWWGGLVKDFVGYGIDGIWNDMNEPAVFDYVHPGTLQDKTMPPDRVHRGDPSVLDYNGKPQGVAGAVGPHLRYHNVWGMLMAKSTRGGIQSARPNKRPFVLSRANYIGGQKYAAAWTGDNTASWEHVKTSIPMVLNLGLSGQPFAGPDIGGYHYPKGLTRAEDAKMYARWMGFAAFFPFARGHYEKNFGPAPTKPGEPHADWHQEPWAFNPAVTATCRLALERRYRLIPYLYSLVHDANTTGMPIMRPAFFANPSDPNLRSLDSEFLFGGDILVSAQVDPAKRLNTTLPRGIWQPFAFRQGDSAAAPLDSADPDQPALYLRGGAIVPTGPITEYVDQKPNAPITLLVCLDANGHASGTLYEDDGDGYQYRRGAYRLTSFTAQRSGSHVIVSNRVTAGRWPAMRRAIRVRLFAGGKEYTGSGVEGKPIDL